MNFLKEQGFTDKDIKDITDSNYENILENIKLNHENVQSIIDYLLGIGIERETLKELFMYQIGLFFKTKEEIQTSFDEYEIDSIVKSLNFDADSVELIEFI